jgi:hypothetical protein
MSGNGGVVKVTHKADLPGLYPVGMETAKTWFHKDCITNLLSFKDLVKVFRVTYANDDAKAFVVHRSDYGKPDLRFVMHPSGLHVLQTEELGHLFVQTVEQNLGPHMEQKWLDLDASEPRVSS